MRRLTPVVAILLVCGGGCTRMHEQKTVKLFDLTKAPARLRVFADNYQFMLFDPGTDPFEPFPEYSEETTKRGWTRNDHALWVLTRAHYNDHRLDVRLASAFEPDPAASRQTAHNMRLPQGMIALFEHPNHIRFQVPPGDYVIYCKAYNLGEEDPNGMAELPDAVFLRHDEWERYELVLVPGVAAREGEL